MNETDIKPTENMNSSLLLGEFVINIKQINELAQR